MFNNGRDCCATAYEKNVTNIPKTKMMRLRARGYSQSTNEEMIRFDSLSCRNDENITCSTGICANRSKF